ncbi:MAG: hypothetical protein RLZZ537_20 [Pseudomonadota bacterium]|jgi:uncharacterized metal-binding protein
MKPGLPLVYSCSGCSSAAQMANQLAIRLDREGLAEMSCIAGVGGGVSGLVKTARSGRPVLAIDGCPMACVRACLASAGVEPNRYMLLSDFKVRKLKHADFDPDQSDRIFQDRIQPAALALGASGDHVRNS